MSNLPATPSISTWSCGALGRPLDRVAGLRPLTITPSPSDGEVTATPLTFTSVMVTGVPARRPADERLCPAGLPAMLNAEILIVAAALPWVCEIDRERARRPPACRRCTGCCRRRRPRSGPGRRGARRKFGSGFLTKVKYAPSPGSNIWLLTPIVSPPPPWLVLIVLLALVNVPSALRTGVLPITTSPLPVSPTMPNRFWPDGRSSKSNASVGRRRVERARRTCRCRRRPG